RSAVVAPRPSGEGPAPPSALSRLRPALQAALVRSILLQRRLTVRQHVIDDAVLLGLLGRENLVPLDVAGDLLDAAASVLREDRLQLVADPHDLVGHDLDVAGLAVRPLSC